MKHTFKSRLPTVFLLFCPFECCCLHKILFYFAQVQELAEREAQLILIDQHHAECARLLNEQRQTLIERESELIQREAALGSLCFTYLSSTPHSFVYSILLVCVCVFFFVSSPCRSWFAQAQQQVLSLFSLQLFVFFM